MKALFTLFLISIFVVSCKVKTSSVQSDKLPDEKPFNEKLDSIYRANSETVGVLVHIECPNKKISWSGAVGYSNKQEKTKIQINQPVLIASNTKTFVAATILRLAEENQLSLTASINEYLSKETKLLLQNKGYDISSIQLIHLLSHTSGINNYAESQGFRDKIRFNPTYKWTRQEQIELAVLSMDKL
ncbi:serine hydrolase [Flavihumibacter sp. R14]|nr:serine hydrolase [Flavihumibacter soli]